METTIPDVDVYTDQAITLAIQYAPSIILAVITLILGLWIISKIIKGFKNIAISRNFDPTLIPFLSSLISIILKIMLIISVASLIGVETTSVIAVLGAASLAIGLALQGSLSNFAGGVLILILKPYKVGDVIETMGHIGTVQEILIFNTILLTADHRTIILPNGAVSNSSITNITCHGTRRVDLVVGISYGDDPAKAKEIIMSVLTSYPEVLTDPAPIVEVLTLNNSSVDIAVRPYVATADYWAVYFKALPDIKVALEANGLSIPFPQSDVHLYPVK